MSIDEESTVMKLDAINLTDQKPQRTHGANAIRSLEQKLRKFFDEADGHGSLMRKPPPAMMTPQYFKMVRTIACYPIRHQLDWSSIVSTVRYKRKFVVAASEAIEARRGRADDEVKMSNGYKVNGAAAGGAAGGVGDRVTDDEEEAHQAVIAAERRRDISPVKN